MLCAILRYCQTTRSSDDVHRPPSARCDCHREVHWSTLWTWHVRHNQEFHTHVEYMCNQKVGVPKSWLHWSAVLYRSPCHPPQPRIAEFWFVREPQNLEIEPDLFSLIISHERVDSGLCQRSKLEVRGEDFPKKERNFPRKEEGPLSGTVCCVLSG